MEDQSEKEAKFRRIRRLKKWMRPLPRRSNVHRYPVLKWFSKTAYERSYLWSFKGNAMIPALFWGIWIAMLPIVGIQMAVAFFVALIVRGPAKPISARGSANTRSPSDAKLAATPPIVGLVSTEMKSPPAAE